ncbi:hypothetical protein [Mucilaginibacter sp. FT3.2]|uniref:hypothetical protein n=1 Tax=Mucilaginibacter sp. FT3.2 TaxID=2723090 RepID=UPI001616BB53|nr:hypothetical protein [Mucilaginibacter sp. FT3.2]MBB6230857.1 putative transcriptional regulator [Mucilaginibacter sp. FT3.2]
MNQLILPDGGYLNQYLDFLPENKIIYKTLTGCGATTLELECQRNSILIEPYIPVIKGKAGGDVFAVHSGVKPHHIIEYFQRDIKHFKLVSTPEGHKNIKTAADAIGLDLYNNFFLLVDECEKLIQDVNFRPKIVEVMDDFFNYKSRSFISATPIPPTDPRFKSKGFDNFHIVPQVTRNINLNLRVTNSLATTLKDYFIKQRNSHYIIFVNSTERIASLIKHFKIETESQVFCSIESAEKLHISKIPYAQEDFEVKKMKKYNFFTSRFFTAFDMLLEFEPNLLIVSDVKKVQHSAVDPFTDVIQIIGRARNGVANITHISNIYEKLPSSTEAEVREYLKGSQEAYIAIRNLRDTTNKVGAFDVLNNALRVISFSSFVNEHDDNVNHFMIDQEVHINRVRGYYKTPDNILNAYIASERFMVCNSFENYNLDDDTIDKLGQGISQTEVIRIISEAFESHFTAAKNVYSLSPNHTLYHLMQTHSLIYQYYKKLGIDKIRELEYRQNAIQMAYERHEQEHGDQYFQLMTALKAIFKRVNKTSAAQVKRILKYYYFKCNIKGLKATVTQLAKWFDVHRTTDGYAANNSEIKIYIIGKPKH